MSRRITALRMLLTLFAIGSPRWVVAASPAESLHQLFADQFEWRKHEFPDFAMSIGDYRHAGVLADHSRAAIERRHRQTQGFLERLQAIDRAALDPTDQLNYDLFQQQLADNLAEHEYRMWLAPVGGRSGPQQTVPQMHERVRFETYADYDHYLSRLEQVPALTQDTVALLRSGVAEGRTVPKITLEGLPAQFQVLQQGGLNDLRTPFEHLPASVSAEQARALQERFDSKTLPIVQTAMLVFGDYVVTEYLPKCRDTVAASALPNGRQYYAHRLRVNTTTDLSAQAIHELGLKEVQRIRTEMMAVIRSSDFMSTHSDAATLPDAELFSAFLKYLRTAPRFYCQTEDELLRGYRDICKRIDAGLPGLFTVLPRLPYGVRKIPDFMAPSQTTAYYSRGDIRNAQPGYFYANTYALDQRPKYEMIALALHEAVPGHHLQVALAQELDEVPAFRRHSWVTAFGEGWALYAERLGLEMRLYDDPYDNFGRLLYEMWRACRLVVDPGMHALGWSRDRAIQFMIDNTALSELNIKNEVDRYISWPGQATAYKVGELKIRELRARAEARLGPRFDLRAFHDQILGAGSLPLTLLEKRIEAWMAQRASG